ncbi:hypothetical protein GLYMA_14G088001v4 [Glycine max]|nr:hypothetical protein GLYMA_14G088001v4 [Glycine max]KAH1093732.1 hypothetical protein GYH30_039455 [Glycine max]
MIFVFCLQLILLHLLKLYQSTEPEQEFWSYPLLHVLVHPGMLL